VKILLTGATGFIGRHVLRELAKTEYEIVATAMEPRLKARDVQIERITYLPYDVNEAHSGIYDFFGRPDAIIHLSWEGLPHYNDLFHFEKNLFANYRFLKYLVQGGLRDFTIVGTCLEYGKQNGRLSEEMVPQPSTSYALAKDTLRRFLEELKKKTEFTLKWIRLFYMYGEGQNKESVLEQVKHTIESGDKEFNMSKGDQLRDYLPVEKVAEYIVQIAMQSRIEGVINCCSGVPISIRSLVEDYMRSVNASVKLNLGYCPYPDYEAMAFWGDTRKLQSALRAKGDN
jgi:nucleoside-diphosphate-sugar epimerase